MRKPSEGAERSGLRVSPSAQQVGPVLLFGISVLWACSARSVADGGLAADSRPRDSKTDVLVYPDFTPGRCGADMVEFKASGKPTCIDRFEASRGPKGEAVSQRGTLPWVDLTVAAAFAACRKVGKRLCTDSEAAFACGGDGPNTGYFPYAKQFDQYQAGRCNDSSLEPKRLRPTGTLVGCEGVVPGLYDMIGNVDEWTMTCNMGIHWCKIAGGSYDRRTNCKVSTIQLTHFDDSYTSPTIGFRCCKDLP